MYPLQTNVATKEFNKLNTKDTDLQKLITEVQNMRATLSAYGMTKLSTASDVTDANAYALSVVEKNASIKGSLNYNIESVKSRLGGIRYMGSLFIEDYHKGETFTTQVESGRYILIASQGAAWVYAYLLAFMTTSPYASIIDIIKAGKDAPTCSIANDGTFSAVSNADCGFHINFYHC